MDKRKHGPALVQVIAFKAPGPKWHAVGTPVERSKAVLIIANEWKSRNLARIIPTNLTSVKAS